MDAIGWPRANPRVSIGGLPRQLDSRPTLCRHLLIVVHAATSEICFSRRSSLQCCDMCCHFVSEISSSRRSSLLHHTMCCQSRRITNSEIFSLQRHSLSGIVTQSRCQIGCLLAMSQIRSLLACAIPSLHQSAAFCMVDVMSPPASADAMLSLIASQG